MRRTTGSMPATRALDEADAEETGPIIKPLLADVQRADGRARPARTGLLLRSCGKNIASNFERRCARPIWSNGAPLIYPVLRFEVREQGKGVQLTRSFSAPGFFIRK